jgi:hypothetical protein
MDSKGSEQRKLWHFFKFDNFSLFTCHIKCVDTGVFNMD